MKKSVLLVLISVIMVFATACSNAKKMFASAKPKAVFSCKASIAYDDFSAVAQIERYGDGVWSAEFSEPSTLAGVCLDFADGEVTASYKGLSFSVPKDAVPVKALISGLIEVFDSAVKTEEIEGESKDGIITVSGTLSQGDYAISFDEKTGYLVSFEMPGSGLKMVFSDFNAKSESTTAATTAVTTVTSSENAQETTAMQTSAVS